MEVLFLCHNSGSFHGEVDPLSVVDQMKIHGILCAERVVGCDGVCNLTMGFDCFLMQCISCAFYKKRNRAVDHRDQPRYHNILTAQGNSSVKLNIFVCVILMIIQQHFYFIAESGDFFYVFFFCVRSCHSCYRKAARRKRTSRRSWISFCLFPIKVNPRGSSTIPGEEAISVPEP